jgi:hypothetical protein
VTIAPEIIELARDGRRFRDRRSKWERFWAAFIVRWFIAVPLNGWILMMTIAAIHHGWWSAVPTIGYWWAVVICLGLTALFGVPLVRSTS